MPELWAGTDAGKAEHHCTVIDANGTTLPSRRVPDSEAELLELLGDVLGSRRWPGHLGRGPERRRGLIVDRAAGQPRPEAALHPRPDRAPRLSGLQGSGKTDAKDAFIIAGTARMRRDLQPLQELGEIAVDLRILTARRIDLAADRTRAINRLRAQLLEYFPALERAFDLSTSKSALILLAGYQTPAALRRIGRSRLTT